jgi:hypothetical protein
MRIESPSSSVFGESHAIEGYLVPWGFAAAAVGSIAGGLIGAGGAESAASQQAGAEESALGLQQSMFNTTLGNEAPFLQGGTQAQSQLNYLMGEGTPGQNGTAASSAAGGFGSLETPFNAQSFKSLSPAYGFQLQQGAQGTLNNDASAQGAESGAALKDLQSYNQNFANTSFNNAFNQYQTQQNNVFGRLNSLATLGQGAASNQATGASSFANSIGTSAAGIGAANAAGTVGAANALSGAAGGIGNAALLGSIYSGGLGQPNQNDGSSTN